MQHCPIGQGEKPILARGHSIVVKSCWNGSDGTEAVHHILPSGLILFSKHEVDIALTGKAGRDPRRILVGWNCDTACCKAFEQPSRSRMGVTLQGFGPFSLQEEWLAV
jgi:hypothetical protein